MEFFTYALSFYFAVVLLVPMHSVRIYVSRWPRSARGEAQLRPPSLIEDVFVCGLFIFSILSFSLSLVVIFCTKVQLSASGAVVFFKILVFRKTPSLMMSLPASQKGFVIATLSFCFHSLE